MLDKCGVKLASMGPYITKCDPTLLLEFARSAGSTLTVCRREGEITRERERKSEREDRRTDRRKERVWGGGKWGNGRKTRR